MKKNKQYFVGIDEVGRGPLAGPVCVCSFVWFGERFPKELNGIKDSKKLTEKKREEWFGKLNTFKKDGMCDFVFASKTAKHIDRYGISFSIKKCIEQTLSNLSVDSKNTIVLLDGGLKAPKEFVNQETIIKGDTKEFVIGADSIIAKVTRDNFMKRQSKNFPEYGFEIHKGYGTLKHRIIIKKKGLTSLHRNTYIH